MYSQLSRDSAPQRPAVSPHPSRTHFTSSSIASKSSTADRRRIGELQFRVRDRQTQQSSPFEKAVLIGAVGLGSAGELLNGQTWRQFAKSLRCLARLRQIAAMRFGKRGDQPSATVRWRSTSHAFDGEIEFPCAERGLTHFRIPPGRGQRVQFKRTSRPGKRLLPRNSDGAAVACRDHQHVCVVRRKRNRAAQCLSGDDQLAVKRIGARDIPQHVRIVRIDGISSIGRVLTCRQPGSRFFFLCQ